MRSFFFPASEKGKRPLFRHYGESDDDKLQAPEDARAYVGHIGPFPAFKESASGQ